jgi:septum formation protein
MSHSELILASASPRRRELLASLGLQFRVAPSSAPELHDESMNLSALCQQNAERKALAVGPDFPSATILGADTLVALDRKLFGKPTSQDEAREMLLALQDRTHQVVTGVALVQSETHKLESFAVSTDVTFKPLTLTEIEHYISSVHVLDKAGAYGIQERRELIVEKISGSYSNVVGLPLEELALRLPGWGFEPVLGRIPAFS